MTRPSPRPHLMWIDLRVQPHRPAAREQLAAHFRITVAPAGQLPAPLPPIDMLCVEFDYPDQRGLQRMLELLHSNPKVPLTMLSLQHSEDLAVWAFRSGVWEFLALPVSPAELQRYAHSVQQLAAQRSHTGLPPCRPADRLQGMPACTAPMSRQQLPLYDVLQHLDKHFRERIDEAEMARQCCMSPAHFSRMFKQAFGIGFQDYITRRRMEAAQQMLQDTGISVSSVAYALGYRDPSYFARAFRRHFGFSPSDYRQPQG